MDYKLIKILIVPQLCVSFNVFVNLITKYRYQQQTPHTMALIPYSGLDEFLHETVLFMYPLTTVTCRHPHNHTYNVMQNNNRLSHVIWIMINY